MHRTYVQRGSDSRSLAGRLAWLVTAALLVIAAVATSSRAHAASNVASQPNTVVAWNDIASTAILVTAGTPPHAGVLSLAMVQGAVYDAVNAIDGGYEPYLAEAAAAAGDSVDAAAATAAYRVLVGFPQRNPALVGLVPTQHATLQPLFAASLASVPDGPSKTGGRAAGRAAAEAMLTARLDDGRGGTFKFTPGTDPGDWRLAPPQGPSPGIVSQDPAPWVGFVRPFLVPNVEMLRTDGPNDLTSEAYLEDFREVKRIGSLTSTRRTADQTAASIFWQDNGAAIWNRVFRSVAMTHDLDVVDSARFLAMTNLAAADGSIGCWNDKAYWSFWRPITAIREAGHDGNPATKADPDWVPLFDPTVPASGLPLVTPGFPDHPSGHSCVSSAIVHSMQDFFGSDNVPFTATSNKCLPAPCPARSFNRLSDALKEIVNARVWSGIHFRTADEQGAELGEEVADYMEDHYFEPTS
jgi:hypothetical protein